MINIKPFDIVTSKYITLNGNNKVGLFLIIDVSDNVVTGCKITSQLKDLTEEYSYLLTINSHPFLQTNSYVQIDKLQTIFLDKCTLLGDMAICCRRGFITKFTKVFGKFRLNLEQYAPDYKSPNKH